MNPSASLFIDNFALQDASHTLIKGVAGGMRSELGASDAPSGYEILKVPSAGVQIETLLQVLNTIVLQDELLVDAKFVETWDQAGSPLQILRSERIIAAKPLLEAKEDWTPFRDSIQEELCFSPQLSIDFASFRKNFRGESDPIFSILLWGTAGMIARSQYLNRPYLGHPSRGRVIRLCKLGSTRTSAEDVFNRFVATERVNLFNRITAGQTTRAISISLPPVALEVIAESNDAKSLIRTALQHREKYRSLREWIGEFQHALEAPPKAKSHIALLEAAAADIDASFKTSWWSRLSFDISLSVTGLPDIGKGITVPIGAMLQRRTSGSIRTAVTQLIQNLGKIKPWKNSSICLVPILHKSVHKY